MLTDLLLDPFSARWPQVRAAALAAEEAGFAGVWMWDHLAGSVHREQSVLDCWTVLSALASVTERINLGPLVLNVANRHPGIVAQMVATLQEISGGRVLLGIGAGGGIDTPYAAEQFALGRQVRGDAARRAQVAEAIGVIRQLWTGRASPIEGRWFSLGSALGFLKPDPPPPIIVGGFGPKMAALAGRVADGFNTQAAHPRLQGLIGTARQAREAAGRDPAGLLVSAFAGLDRRWLYPDSRERERLEGHGVSRLILIVQPPFDPELIRAAGKLLPAP